MQTQESLKKKLSTVQDLLSVVKTMKSLAAVNIRSYERAVESLGHYERVVNLSWRALFPTHGRILPLAAAQSCVVFVIGSDQGMCGQFNETIAETAKNVIRSQRERKREVHIWTSGERIRAAMEDAGLPPVRHFSLPGTLPGITRQIGALLQAYTGLHTQGASQRFLLLHNQLEGQSSYTPRSFQLFPLDETWFEQLGDKGWPGRSLPLLGPGPEHTFRDLLSQYLFISIYRGFAQSMAAENAARLAAMQAAEKNIQDLQEELETKYRETRQKAITEELFDVIAGFEALGEEE